jgi:hypothetical protein
VDPQAIPLWHFHLQATYPLVSTAALTAVVSGWGLIANVSPMWLARKTSRLINNCVDRSDVLGKDEAVTVIDRTSVPHCE